MPRWVDALFARLLARYGDAWTRKWEGIPEDALKADWCDQLASVVSSRPKAVTHALNNLPADFPPNSEQFRKLCTGFPEYIPALASPAVKPDPEKVAAAMQAVVQKPAAHDPAKAAADALRARRERSGGKLGLPQKAQLQALEAIGK
jgi:hypothetical protein